MKENRATGKEPDNHMATPQPEQRDDVYKPVEMALEQNPDVDNYSAQKQKNHPFRQRYLDELKRDLEEITEEIIKAENLKDALSPMTTKYAIERNILSHERSLMSEENLALGDKRTQASLKRTELAENRSGLSRLRTKLAQQRTFLAEKRTLMSQQRTFLAKARTQLAYMRTGVALVALASGLIRYFGLGWWTVADGCVLVFGLAMVTIGIYYYIQTLKGEGRLVDIMRQKEEELMQRKPRIMVLDDDITVCNSLKVYLGRDEWRVETFTSPYVARHSLEVAHFDVVVTDFMMEEMTGIEFLHLIQRLSPGTQVILISRMEMLDEFVESFNGELFDSFSKPINVKELKASIKRALEEQMVLKETA